MTEIQLPRDDIDKVANQIGIEVDNPPSNTSSPSSDYSTSSSTSHNTATSVPSISGAKSNQRTRPYKGKDTPLEGYLYERGKLFRHLERRFEKYQTKANKEKDKFKKERQRSKVDPPKKVNNQKTPPRDNAQPVNQPVAAQQKQTSVVQAPIVDTKPQISTKKQQPDRQVENSNMIGSTSTAARSAVKRSVQTLASNPKPKYVCELTKADTNEAPHRPTHRLVFIFLLHHRTNREDEDGYSHESRSQTCPRSRCGQAKTYQSDLRPISRDGIGRSDSSASGMFPFPLFPFSLSKTKKKSDELKRDRPSRSPTPPPHTH